MLVELTWFLGSINLVTEKDTKSFGRDEFFRSIISQALRKTNNVQLVFGTQRKPKATHTIEWTDKKNTVDSLYIELVRD